MAKVNGKAISVIDIMKKMDMIFYRKFPQYASSIEARFQFYNMNWKHFLSELIDKELMMADAEEIKMEVSHGDIRQEMENMFGPNIISNLDKAGLTYEEAWQMVKEDQLLKRMMGARVNSLAVRSVTPINIRKAYEEYAKNNLKPDAWRYQVISIKGKDPTLCAEVANYAYQLVSSDNIAIADLKKKLDTDGQFKDSATINISEEYLRTGKEINDTYREILSSLQANTYSKPSAQKSRAGEQVYRIVYLKEFIPGRAPPLSEVEMKLKSTLIDKKIDQEAEKYIARLRRHFDVQGDENHPLYPEDFQPFVLK